MFSQPKRRGFSKQWALTDSAGGEDEQDRIFPQEYCYFARKINEGEVLQEDMLDYKRQGEDCLRCLQFVLGKPAKRDLEYDELLEISDF